MERKGGLRAAALRLRSTLRSFAANFLFARLEVNNEAVNRRRRCDRELKPEGRSLLLERPDEEDSHQRGDADGEHQQGQLLGLALSLPGARLGFHGFHDAASLPQSAIPGNGPTVEGTGVTYLKFLGGGREVSGARPASSIKTGQPRRAATRRASALALVDARLVRHQFSARKPLWSGPGPGLYTTPAQIDSTPRPWRAPVIPPSRCGRRQIRSG